MHQLLSLFCQNWFQCAWILIAAKLNTVTEPHICHPNVFNKHLNLITVMMKYYSML